jgi:hypothetical protein
MNESPAQEKAINGALNQSARTIDSIKEGLSNYNTYLNRIEERPSVAAKTASEPHQSFEGLTLTGKIRYIEEALGLIGTELQSLNNLFNSLI